MKKLIDLPDNPETIKKLKKKAIDSGKSFKAWIEEIILSQLK